MILMHPKPINACLLIRLCHHMKRITNSTLIVRVTLLWYDRMASIDQSP